MFGVLRSVSHCRQTLSAFQQFLICAVGKVSLWVQPIPVAVIDQNEQTPFSSAAKKQPKPCWFSLVHQEMLRSYQSCTTDVVCLRCDMEWGGMRKLPAFICKYKAVVVSIFIFFSLYCFSRNLEKLYNHHKWAMKETFNSDFPLYQKKIVLNKRLRKGKSSQGVWFFWNVRICFQHQWLSCQQQPKNASRFKLEEPLSLNLSVILQWLSEFWKKVNGKKRHKL